jgi:hypothetical protein
MLIMMIIALHRSTASNDAAEETEQGCSSAACVDCSGVDNRLSSTPAAGELAASTLTLSPGIL